MRFSDVVALVFGVLMITALAAKPRADTWLVLTTASYHFDRSVQHNERNYGLGIEHDLAENWRLAVGMYDNSYYRISVYGMASYMPVRAGALRLGVSVGLTSGYDRVVGPFTPTLLPTVSIEGKRFGANIGVLPSVVGLQLKWRF